MQWIEREQSDAKPAPAFAALTQAALERFPDKPRVKLAAAEQASNYGDYGEALVLFEDLIESGQTEGIDWLVVSKCYLRDGQAIQALDACERAEATGDTRPERHFARGRVLAVLELEEEAIPAFLAAAEGLQYHDPCLAILDIYARRRDGAALIEESTQLEARFGDSSVFRLGRALGHSLLGQEGEAARLIDLERHVEVRTLRDCFEGNFDEFNRQLAAEARSLAEVSLDTEAMIEPRPPLANKPAHRRLSLLVRDAIEAYLAQAEDRGLSECLPLPIERGELLGGVTILRKDGSNGRHIHRQSVLSAVYHVEVPQAVLDADDDRGGLLVGATDQFTGGYQACWGTRVIKPNPGQLTIFPAHIHHDVIPSRCDELRISMPFDLHLVE